MTRTPGVAELLIGVLPVMLTLHGPNTTTGAPPAGLVTWAAVVGQLPAGHRHVPLTPLAGQLALAAWLSSVWSWVAVSACEDVVLLVVTVGGWICPLLAA